MANSLPAVRAVPLEGFPTAYPHLRFAARFPDGQEITHDADARHPLAGAGKLVFACAVARLAEQDADLLAGRVTLTADHRSRARTGTLRAMASELSLTVDDAMALVVGTGDGACALALLEYLGERGHDVLEGARRLVADLGLGDTELTGLEPDGNEAGTSAGEGIVGESTPADLCTLSAAVPDRVLGWMGKVFEPAGLASALPGFGPRTVPHQTVSGGERTDGPTDPATGSPPGTASVLVLPGAVVAAYGPAAHPDGTVITELEASTALGSLGLAVLNRVAGRS